MDNVIAIIPARGNSKSIKNKNMALINNKPMLYYTINAAKKSKYINQIILTSNSDKILKYGKTFGITTLKRPDSICMDKTHTSEVILHVLQYFKCQYIILLQPTSPFRTSDHINKAFETFISSNSETLISVNKCNNKILKAFIVKPNNTIRGIHNNIYPFTPRQELPQTYMSNGAIYILKYELFIKNRQFLTKNTSYYDMDEVSSMDIDSYYDLEEANRLIKHMDNS